VFQKRPPFLNNFVKHQPILMIFGKFNPEKVRQTAPASHARCSHFTLGNPEKVKSVLKMRSAAEIGHFFETQCMYVCVCLFGATASPAETAQPM